MLRRTLIVAVLGTGLLLAPHAHGDVPVHVRVIKATRNVPPKIDPRLESLRRQLSVINYASWEQVDEIHSMLKKGKTEFFRLPDGQVVGLTVQDERPDAVTFEVAVAAQNTQSRLTIERGQRIVHQVTGAKNGVAYFLTVIWP